MTALGPLVLSLQVATVATALAAVIGVPLARWLARRGQPGSAPALRELVSTAVLLPMVLPPTVLGYGLLLLLGRQSPIGRLFEEVAGAPLVFTPTAATLAAFIAALPFLVRASQGAFEQVDPLYEDAARTLGRTELAIFRTVTVPLAWRGIAAGVVLAFARAMGEFGATVMVAGNVPGRTRTASVAVYDLVQGGRTAEAGALALALALVTGAVVLAVGRLGRR